MAKTKISLIKDSREGRSKPWLVRWHGRYDPTICKQKRYSKSFALKKEAERFIEQLQADFDTGMPRDQKDISLEELCEKFLRTNDNKLMDGTKKLYNDSFQRLLDYFGASTSPKIIAQEQAEEFLAQIDYIHPYLVNKAKEPSASLRNRICRNCM